MSGSPVPEIRLVGLTKRFGEVAAVDGVDLEIRAGEFFSLLGPSGCGKTTTLRMIGGFELPDRRPDPARRPRRHPRAARQAPGEHGVPELRAVPAPHRRRERRLRPAAPEDAGRETRHRVERRAGARAARRATTSASRDQLVGRPAAARRARPGAGQPAQVLLLDEPLGALDLKLRRQLQVELKRIQIEVGITFVYVTHDQEEALALSDRIAVMDARQGRAAGLARGAVRRPATRFVADFIGTTNLLPGTVEGVDGEVAVIGSGQRGAVRGRRRRTARAGEPSSSASARRPSSCAANGRPPTSRQRSAGGSSRSPTSVHRPLHRPDDRGTQVDPARTRRPRSPCVRSALAVVGRRDEALVPRVRPCQQEEADA